MIARVKEVVKDNSLTILGSAERASARGRRHRAVRSVRDSPGYSDRNAMTGSAPIARRAGMRLASSATTSSIPPTAA